MVRPGRRSGVYRPGGLRTAWMGHSYVPDIRLTGMTPSPKSALFCYRRCAEAAVGVALASVLIVCAAGAIGGVIADVSPVGNRCHTTAAQVCNLSVPPVENRCHTGAPVLTLKAPRVVVLKARRILYLFDGDALVRAYPIDLGRVPVGPKQRKGDDRTPVGGFHVVTKNPHSPYRRFLGIDYPDARAVERGIGEGLISPGEAASICGALETGQCPDWGTALGGGIGLHGHRLGRDWTAGCIALSDRHVDELFAVLRIGDPVEILP